MCLYKDTQIVSGFIEGDYSYTTPVFIYNISKGIKETVLCSVRKDNQVTGLDIIAIDNAQYIVVTLLYRLHNFLCSELGEFE